MADLNVRDVKAQDAAQAEQEVVKADAVKAEAKLYDATVLALATLTPDEAAYLVKRLLACSRGAPLVEGELRAVFRDLGIGE